MGIHGNFMKQEFHENKAKIFQKLRKSFTSVTYGLTFCLDIHKMCFNVFK